jgi:hypothetical protein
LLFGSTVDINITQTNQEQPEADQPGAANNNQEQPRADDVDSDVVQVSVVGLEIRNWCCYKHLEILWANTTADANLTETPILIISRRPLIHRNRVLDVVGVVGDVVVFDVGVDVVLDDGAIVCADIVGADPVVDVVVSCR